MVDTRKFSQFANGGDLQNSNITVGLELGANVQFNNPWTFLPPGNTAARPPVSPDMFFRLRFNTQTLAYEYYDSISATWIEIEDSASVLPLLASHLVGEGASLIGLQNQSNVNNKTVQDFANATFIAQVSNGTLQNAQYTGLLPNGFVSVTTGTGVLDSRTISGTTNQIDVTNSDGQGDSIHSISPTFSFPGTFTVQGSTAIDQIINDNTLATATASNLASALSIKTYIDNTSAGQVDSVVGTANQIDVDNTDPQNPVLSLSSTLNLPGTFTIQGTTVISAIIDDDTMATALATNIPTAESVKAYVDAQIGGSGVINPGLINELAYYAAAGTTLSGLTTANNGVLVTSAGGVPSISSTLPSGLTIPSPRITTGILDANGNNMLLFNAIASAVNSFQMQNNTTTNNPIFSTVGSDTNIGGFFDSKGTSGIYIKGQQTGATPAGYRGEVISSQLPGASGVAYTTTTARNITSIDVTAGTWLVLGVVAFTGSGAVQTQVTAWTSLTSATIPDVSLRAGESSSAQTQFNFPTAPLIVNATGLTTVYLSGQTVFASGSVTGSGYIVAIRL